MLDLMPYIEHGSIYQHWDFTKSVAGNINLAAADISVFYCPSRRVGLRRGDNQIMFNPSLTSGGTDYGGCIGRINGWDNTLSGSTNSHTFVPGQYIFDVSGSDPSMHGRKCGIFLPNHRTQIKDVKDGLSHTIIIGELQRLQPKAGETGYDKWSHTSNDGWAVAGVATLFTCAIAGEGTDIGQPGGLNNGFFEDAGSEHPGIAQFGFADGSVRSISENIDTQLYAYLGSMADKQIAAIPFD